MLEKTDSDFDSDVTDRRTICPLVGPSVGCAFFFRTAEFKPKSAPVHPYATDAVVYTALFSLGKM